MIFIRLNKKLKNKLEDINLLTFNDNIIIYAVFLGEVAQVKNKWQFKLLMKMLNTLCKE